MMATVRRVRRVIRKFDPWTVFKVSLLLHVVFAAATLIGLLLMWSLVERAGIPASLDRFLITISLVDEGSVFFDNGSRFTRVAIFFSVVFGAAMTLLTTLAAVFYNLTSDVVGGRRGGHAGGDIAGSGAPDARSSGSRPGRVTRGLRRDANPGQVTAAGPIT